ncbi:MAG: molecular chaperone HscB [Alteromonadaceae bacterium]|jgi:molecular chaperone HscB
MFAISESAKTVNYFELFNLPFQFEVKLAGVSDTYRELQRVVHPDKFANAGEHEQLIAVQKSAQVNDAFQTLKNPLLRAQYMLAEQGVDLQIEQKTLQDPTFLMQQMELREQLEDIAALDEPDDEIVAMEQEIKQITSQLYQQLIPLLVSGCKIELENAANIVRKLKFTNKLREELDRLEESLQ